MHVGAKRLKFGKLGFDELYDCLLSIAQRNSSKSIGYMFDSNLFGWNHDVFDILVDGKK